MSIAEAKPPIINFVKKPVENRDASVKEGFACFTDVDYIELIPHGSGGKAKMEYVYAEWIERIKAESRKGDDANPSRFPMEWVTKIQAAYAAWNAGQELPVDGTPIKMWPIATPSEVRNCEGAELRTVEDLAQANEEGIMRLGMGGRALSEKAKAWVQTKRDPAAKTSAELAALRQENKDLKLSVADQQGKLELFARRLQALENEGKVAKA